MFNGRPPVFLPYTPDPTRPPLIVAVGRFQVPEPHEGHINFIREGFKYSGAKDWNENMLIVLGVNDGPLDERNPFPFEVRQQVIANIFGIDPSRVIKQVDTGCNIDWSNRLDEQIERFREGRDVVLIGSRDSIISNRSYEGRFYRHIIEETPGLSGTAVRARLSDEKEIMRRLIEDSSAREIWAGCIATRKPYSHTNVSVAPYAPDGQSILLEQNENDKGLWRFIGDFYDPNVHESFETSAAFWIHRKTGLLMEEEHLEYLGSQMIPDWRYMHTMDQVTMMLYAAPFAGGIPEATKPGQTLRFHHIASIVHRMVPEHENIARKLANHFNFA